MLAELERLMTEAEVAKVLNTATGTLRNWRSLKKGPPFVLVGEAIRYSPTELRRYIESRTVRMNSGRRRLKKNPPRRSTRAGLPECL